MSPKISIIVPVYNMDRYLGQCMDSIRRQTIADWECIIIDDGSADRSSEICERYAKGDTRFRVVHERNGGLSHALNAGLDLAKGEYIGFVDADDWVEPRMFEILYRLAEENDAEMAQCGYIKEYKGYSHPKKIVESRMTLSGKKAMHDIGIGTMPSYKWIRLHRRDIITCRYPEGRNFEDVFVYGEWLKHVRRMVVDPTPLYHYRMRKGSIVHSDYARNRYDYFLSCLQAMKMIGESEGKIVTDDEKNAYIYRSAVRACKLIARNESDAAKRIEAIEKIRTIALRYALPSAETVGTKNYRRALLLRESSRKFSKALRLFNRFSIERLIRESRYFD